MDVASESIVEAGTHEEEAEEEAGMDVASESIVEEEAGTHEEASIVEEEAEED